MHFPVQYHMIHVFQYTKRILAFILPLYQIAVKTGPVSRMASCADLADSGQNRIIVAVYR